MLRRVLPILAVALVTACGGGGDPAGPGDSEVGAYTLQTINGATLPTTVTSNEGVRVSITAGALTLRADRTFLFSITGGTPGSATTATSTTVGTYTTRGTALTLREDGPGGLTQAGSYANGRVTLTEEGLVLVYAR